MLTFFQVWLASGPAQFPAGALLLLLPSELPITPPSFVINNQQMDIQRNTHMTVLKKEAHQNIQRNTELPSFVIRRASRSCRKSVWERPRKSDASQDEEIFFLFLPSRKEDP